MLAVYKYDDTEKQLRKQARIEPDVWINAIDPTPDELATLQAKTHVPEAFLLYGLDEDESARFEYDEDADASLIIFDNPTVTRDDHRNFAYETDPLAIILTKRAIITINKLMSPCSLNSVIIVCHISIRGSGNALPCKSCIKSR